MPLKYRPYERRALENLLEHPGLPADFAYGVFSDVQGGALERMYDQVQRQRDRQQQRQAMQREALSGLGSSLTEAALGGVPAQGLEALVGLQSVANPALQGAQGLDRLMSSATALSGSVLGDTSPFFDEEDRAQVREAVEMAWSVGIRDEAQIEQAIVSQLGDAGESNRGFIREIVQNTASRLRLSPSSPAVTLPSPQSRGGTGALDSLGPVLPEVRGANSGWQDVFGVFPGLFR
jgi:hypothetical protein